MSILQFNFIARFRTIGWSLCYLSVEKKNVREYRLAKNGQSRETGNTEYTRQAKTTKQIHTRVQNMARYSNLSFVG